MKRMFIFFAGLGDLVMLVPFLRALSEDAELHMLTRGYGVPLFAGQEFVKKTYGLAHPNRGRKGLAKLLLSGHRRELGLKLAEEKYDEVIIVGQERAVIRDWISTWIGDGKLRVGTYPEQDPERFAKAFKTLGLGLEGKDPFPVLDIPEEAAAKAGERVAAVGERVVAVQVGSGPANVWFRRKPNLKGLSYRQWADLIEDIIEEGSADSFVFHGTEKETRDYHGVAGLVSEKNRKYLHDWTGKCKINELKAVLSKSYAMLSVDTGPAHIAAAVGCPLMVCFGPADPVVYPIKGHRPVEVLTGSVECQYCMGTPAFKSCRDNICMQSLDRDTLFSGWKRLNDRIRNGEMV